MDVEIIPFAARYRADFARLNLAWLERWFRVEAIDQEVLHAPETHLLAGGGEILFARIADEIVGTCALKQDSPGVFELTKMAVDERFQGRRIGQRLLRAAIHAFKQRAGTELFLESSTRLERALDLYRRNGFELQPSLRPESHYQRADVYMIYRAELDPDFTAMS